MVIGFYEYQIAANAASDADVEVLNNLKDPLLDAAITVLACANVMFELPFMSVRTIQYNGSGNTYLQAASKATTYGNIVGALERFRDLGQSWIKNPAKLISDGMHRIHNGVDEIMHDVSSMTLTEREEETKLVSRVFRFKLTYHGS